MDRNEELVNKFFTYGYQVHNYEKVMEILSEDYIDHSPANARSNKDAVEILKIVEGMYTDMKININDIFSQDNKVAVRVQFTALHAGLQISFEALEHFRIENGKIVESWGYWPEK